jgi:hypothetical protein
VAAGSIGLDGGLNWAHLAFFILFKSNNGGGQHKTAITVYLLTRTGKTTTSIGHGLTITFYWRWLQLWQNLLSKPPTAMLVNQITKKAVGFTKNFKNFAKFLETKQPLNKYAGVAAKSPWPSLCKKRIFNFHIQ